MKVKNSKVVLLLTTEQHDILKKRAEQCGMSFSDYCRFVLINAKPKIEDVSF